MFHIKVLEVTFFCTFIQHCFIRISLHSSAHTTVHEIPELTLKVLVKKLLHWDTLKQDNYSTVGGDGGCRVGEVRTSTTFPMPDHKGFRLQYLSGIYLPTPFLSEF